MVLRFIYKRAAGGPLYSRAASIVGASSVLYFIKATVAPHIDPHTIKIKSEKHVFTLLPAFFLMVPPPHCPKPSAVVKSRPVVTSI